MTTRVPASPASAPRLVRPSSQYEHSHASYVAELLDRGEGFVPWVIAEAGDDFAEYIERLEGYADGTKVPTGFVPSSTFWLLDDSGQIVAISNLRHRLTESLMSFGGHIGFGVRPSARRRGYATEVLRQTLIEARKIGIEDVLVTCDKGNVGSCRTILRNGGRWASEEHMAEHSGIVQRYWIRRA